MKMNFKFRVQDSRYRFAQASVLSPVICFILVFYSAGLPAQILQPARFEKQQKNFDDYYHVISLKEEGLALFRERDKYKNNNRLWELVLLDTALQERKAVELEIKDRYKMMGHDAVPGALYLLYRTGETTKNDFELIEINVQTGEEKRYTIKPDLDFKLTYFIKTGDNFAFGGYVNNEPGIFLYELSSGRIKVVPGFFQKDTELFDMRANQNQTFNTMMVDRSSRNDRKLVFRTFDSNGEMLLDDIVPIDENKTLQTGITSTLEREDLMVLGTWGERNSKQSNGFFTMSVDPYADQKIKFYNFAELNHYLDYLKPKKATKVKEKSEEDSKLGRIPGFTNYVMPYKISEHKNGYLLLAEVYTPSNNNSNYNTPYYNPYYTNPYGFSPYGSGYYYPGMSRMYRPVYGNNVKNMEEIKTNETILLSVDGSGKVLWDFSIALEDVKVAGLEQVADFAMTSSKVFFLYKKETELKIKWIALDDGSTEDLSEKIKSLEPADEIRSDKESEGGTRHWYGHSFYVWGYQTIRNVTKEDRSRDVFYVNKVEVH
jgi:hypothetical protein